MKKLNMIILAAVSAASLALTGCSSVSGGSASAYGAEEMAKFVQFHNRDYMEDKDVAVPAGVDETDYPPRPKKGQKAEPVKSPFASLPTFEQTTRESGSDKLRDKVFNALKEDCENKMAATNRFPVAQIRYGLADKDVRDATQRGTANAADLDVSEMVPGDFIMNIRVLVSTKDMLSGSTNTKTVTMEWKCALVHAKNNQPVAKNPPFSITVDDTIVQKVGRTGRVRGDGGLRWDSSIEQEAFLLNLSKMAQLKFLNYLYENFPVGGYLTDIDLDNNLATVRASRATGLLPNMEMVIYAREKGNDEANRIALFNATCQPGKIGTSTMEIWRASDKKNAKRIIKMLEEDKQKAKEQYDFYAVSDGLAEPPPFIQAHSAK